MGTKTLPFVRSAFVRSTDGKDTREHVNFITHFLDASQVLSTMTTLCRTFMMVCHSVCRTCSETWGSSCCEAV